MNNISMAVEAQIKDIAQVMDEVRAEVGDLFKYYFTSASALVNGLADNATPATTAAGGSLSKGKILSGITSVEALNNFFGNAAVFQSDHMANILGLINSSITASSPISGDLENIGSRLKSLGGTLISLHKKCASVRKAYVASELSLAVAAISSSTVVPGCSTTKSKMVDGIDLATQFVNLMENQAVSQADWAASVARWVKE